MSASDGVFIVHTGDAMLMSWKLTLQSFPNFRNLNRPPKQSMQIFGIRVDACEQSTLASFVRHLTV
jgi:hypothetical protein